MAPLVHWQWHNTQISQSYPISKFHQLWPPFVLDAPAPTTLVNLKGVWESIGDKSRRILQTELHHFEDGSHGVHDLMVKIANDCMIFRVTPAVLAQPDLDEFRIAMSNPTFHTTLTLQEGEMLVVTNGTGAVPMTHGRGADPMSAKAGGQSSKKRHLIRGFLETVGPPT